MSNWTHELNKIDQKRIEGLQEKKFVWEKQADEIRKKVTWVEKICREFVQSVKSFKIDIKDYYEDRGWFSPKKRTAMHITIGPRESIEAGRFFLPFASISLSFDGKIEPYIRTWFQGQPYRVCQPVSLPNSIYDGWEPVVYTPKSISPDVFTEEWLKEQLIEAYKKPMV